MKALPCNTPGCGPHAGLRSGRTHISASNPGRYTCARCKRPNALSAAGWARLRPLKRAEFAEHGYPDLPTRDLVGAGLAKEHAEDMFDAGFGRDMEEVHLLSRAGEDERQFLDAGL